MRCCSCGADIPPQWKHAIASNICPGCSGSIMTDDSKELLDEIAGAFARMPNDPQGLAGWLLSNYRFKKIGSAEPTEHFYTASNQSNSQNNIPNNQQIKIAPNYNEYLNRASQDIKLNPNSPAILAVKNSKASKLQEMANMVSSLEDNYGNAGQNISDNSGIDESDVRAYNELIASGIDPFKGGQLHEQPSKHSGALSPAQIMALKRNTMPQENLYDSYDSYDENQGQSTVGYGDDVLTPEEERLMQTEKGREFVQVNRLKRIKAQDALGGAGAFRRS